ncbi:hypothetical protein JAAARDRAFT_200694 [Jaapia argillacea MUCL 33604]|uniref:Uncharacterized protein n=1 Tax=Jaapia argillacea MUCL 33604 TaxID=933084 RepID=A0A067P3Z3_9AGAM|nr:hypothetical protein JAAARDRAFT_200694 [Jaapia argillacea MUCL 33604]
MPNDCIAPTPTCCPPANSKSAHPLPLPYHPRDRLYSDRIGSFLTSTTNLHISRTDALDEGLVSFIFPTSRSPLSFTLASNNRALVLNEWHSFQGCTEGLRGVTGRVNGPPLSGLSASSPTSSQLPAIDPKHCKTAPPPAGPFEVPEAVHLLPLAPTLPPFPEQVRLPPRRPDLFLFDYLSLS